MLERYAMKVARTVLRGGSDSNATPLPDHPTGGSLRVFRPFAWLEAGSVKTALSRPTHQPSSGCYATGNAHRWALQNQTDLTVLRLT
jgi:hypothetical protein